MALLIPTLASQGFVMCVRAETIKQVNKEKGSQIEKGALRPPKKLSLIPQTLCFF